jgi:hypothetical protein
LDYLNDAISSRIGKPVELEMDFWIYDDDQGIFLECLDEASCWNMADYILRQNEDENHSSDDAS